MIEQFLADGRIHPRHGVYSDTDIELLDGFPDRIKLGMIEGARADGSRDHDADRALGSCKATIAAKRSRPPLWAQCSEIQVLYARAIAVANAACSKLLIDMRTFG